MSSLRSGIVRFLLRKSQIWNKPLPEIRKTMEGVKAEPIPDGIHMRRTVLNGVSCAAFHHEEKSKKAVLYFHGGGFCLGIYDANCAFAAKIAKLSKLDVYMPDYRLAPENPFPAALDDAVAVYQGLTGMGYAARDIVVAADSSGCALAVSALLAVKQSGSPMPSAVVCITPVFDLTGVGETYRTIAKKDPFQLIDPLGVAKNYIGGNDPASLLLSPLFGDLKGLPPVFIHAAEYDVFLSDATRFAQKAKDSHVAVTIKIWDRMWHIFPMQDKLVPEAKAALRNLCSEISQ